VTGVDTAPSIVRTAAPIAAGWLVGLALHYGVHVDQAAALGLLTPTLSAAYYALVRLAEQHLGARWGWLLGWAKAPSYTPSSTTSTPSSTSTAAS
jgi:hypothetical protein